MVPTRGCSRGSTTRVRKVPRALELPGQSLAIAGNAVRSRVAASRPSQRIHWGLCRPPCNIRTIENTFAHPFRPKLRAADERDLNSSTGGTGYLAGMDHARVNNHTNALGACCGLRSVI